LSNQTSIDAAIAAASAAAKAAVPATIDQTSTALATVQPGKARSMLTALETTGTTADLWVKVDASGIKLGSDHKIYENFTAKIELDKVKAPYALRYSVNDSATYKKSYDGVVSTDGRPWAEVVAEGKRIDPKATVYDAVEVIMTLNEPLQKKDGSIIEAGTQIGYQTAPTGFRNFKSWYGDAVSAFGPDAEVTVLVGYEVKSKKGNKDWGVCTFETVQ
jgi:hypothetical protein